LLFGYLAMAASDQTMKAQQYGDDSQSVKSSAATLHMGPGAEDDDPVTSAKKAKANAERFLYEYNRGTTIYDRFPGIPAPGGVRMLQKLSSCYEAQIWAGTLKGGFDPAFQCVRHSCGLHHAMCSH
jgi:hypothetical protein